LVFAASGFGLVDLGLELSDACSAVLARSVSASRSSSGVSMRWRRRSSRWVRAKAVFVSVASAAEQFDVFG
jgi:hypothetical protein